MVLMPSDDDLARRAAQRDHEAFATLHERHANRVFGYLRARSRNDGDAEEIAQQTWVQLTERLGDFDPARGGFIAFALHWAGIVLRRYYAPRLEPAANEDALASATVAFVEEVEDAERADLLRRLLAIVFSGTPPAHQLVAFGFCKLLGWKPGRVVDELAAVPLRAAATRLTEGYLAASRLPEDDVRACFAPLHGRLAGEEGDATLGSLLTADRPAEAQVTGWWWSVRRYALRAAERELGSSIGDLS